eukprot:CAMPEP_0118879678 /NCGR_PEP_ID=MMETSP1163-20130328/19417_1 /TAXON_ID=124430 /ORGANISM="Phaeomonas parva, Strain CCMP2877" /LENGTH=54 /DNA_ID=CAMNT_0006815889 /DNA_START=251 /DNA_END=412 /DNA_ORIENTATION=+
MRRPRGGAPAARRLLLLGLGGLLLQGSALRLRPRSVEVKPPTHREVVVVGGGVA